MGLHLAQVISQLINGVIGQVVGGNYFIMDKGRGPAINTGAGMHHGLHKSDHSRILNLYPGDACPGTGDGQGHFLKQWKVKMNIEGTGLQGGKTIENVAGGFPNPGQVMKGLWYAQVGRIVAADLHPEEGTKFLILFNQRVFEIGAQNMMALLNTLESGH